ncbi:hypothetical protein V2P24_01570 [Mycoplasma putrefaciens]|uniref:hypothetical protein n=1 Tax=Mycoplasma putrefaciens TaxID=2123 RepID=UPI003DA4CBF4
MQELYLKLIYLAKNIIKTEKLRYFIYKDAEFRDKFLVLINNILTLETNFEMSFEGQTYAKEFAKAFILITKQAEKQRFETFDDKTQDQISDDLDQLVKFIVKEYKVPRTKLLDQTELVTVQVISQSTELTNKMIEKWDQKVQESKTEQTADKPVESVTKPADLEAKNNQNLDNAANNLFSSLNQNILSNPDIPPIPTQDPRFYPYKTKPKFMPTFKIILSVLSAISTILLITTLSYLSLTRLDIKNGFDNGFDWNTYVKDSNKLTFLERFPLVGLGVRGFTSVISTLFYILPTAFICSYTKKSNSNPREKYRMSLLPVIVFLVLFGAVTATLSNFASISNISNAWKKELLGFITDEKEKFASQFDSFWQQVVNKYGPKINIAVILSITSMSLTIVTLIVAVILLIVNPKLDREKIQKATTEYQKVVLAAMNGEKYEMDPSIYDHVEVQIKEPSKFKLFLMKFKSKKDKSNDQKEDK